MFVHLIICDLNSLGLDSHVLLICKWSVYWCGGSLCSCNSTLTVWGTYTLSHPHTLTHSCLTCSNPWIYRAALKIKFLLQIIFLVIRKYTCSQREECSDAMATWRLLTSPSSVSLVLGYFVCSVSAELYFSVPLLFHFVILQSDELVTTFFHVIGLYLTFLSLLIFLFLLCFHRPSFKTKLVRCFVLPHRHSSLCSSIHPCISKSGFRSFHHCGADACRPRLRGYFQLLFPLLCTLFPLFFALVLFERSLHCCLL